MTGNGGPLVSVIILNYNGKHYLEHCLSSVLNSDYPNFEVLFVDNASTDGSVDLVRTLFASDPRLKIVTNRERALEHLDYPNSCVRCVKEALKIRGHFLVSVPNDYMCILGMLLLLRFKSIQRVLRGHKHHNMASKLRSSLEPLLQKLGSTDLFLHDSEHSYENMMFEFETTWPFLRRGGILLADDVTANNAFADFVRTKKPIYWTAFGRLRASRK